MNFQFLEIGFENMVVLVTNMNPNLGKQRIIARNKGIEAFSVEFCCPVSTHQLIFEIDTYLRNDNCFINTGSSNFKRCKEVFTSIGSYYAHR